MTKPFLEKHPLPWSLAQSPLKVEPTIRDANDVTVEEIPFSFLLDCVNNNSIYKLAGDEQT